MRIAVVDGQGGGVGRHLTERIRRALGERLEIIALGTNATATAAMLKAGANEGATGENAIVRNVGRVDVIVGSVAILAAHSMLGELTPAMAEAVAASPGVKLLIPLNRSQIEIVGSSREPLPHLIEALTERLKELEGEIKNV
ncbi:MAG: DUF3842 family protein [Clostridia bacterium]|nr:MAG: DUF3842 family protein [Clostridia bacterium]